TSSFLTSGGEPILGRSVHHYRLTLRKNSRHRVGAAGLNIHHLVVIIDGDFEPPQVVTAKDTVDFHCLKQRNIRYRRIDVLETGRPYRKRRRFTTGCGYGATASRQRVWTSLRNAKAICDGKRQNGIARPCIEKKPIWSVTIDPDGNDDQ